MGTVNVTLGEDTRLNLILGQQDENEVREVIFDFSDWYTTYGSGTISLAIQRPKDEWPYEGTLTVDNSTHKATWEISDTDSAYAGVGQIQLSYTVGTAVKKSVVYRFTVYKSLGATGNVITPVQLQTWMDEVDQEITDIKQDLQNAGMSEDFKQALHDILEKVAFIDEDGQDYLDALDNAMWPPTNLVSISAVFTQGQNVIYETDTLDTLKQYLVVTAHYSDSTTETVTSYALSGTLTEGTSTITVSYYGKTTTFNVVVSAPAHTVLEYIASSGTQYINTGLVLGYYDEVTIVLEDTGGTNDDTVYWGVTEDVNGGTKTSNFGPYNTSYSCKWAGATASTSGNIRTRNTKIKLSALNASSTSKTFTGYDMSDNVLFTTTKTGIDSSDNPVTNPIYIFARNFKGEPRYNSTFKFYEMIIKDQGGTERMHLIPVLKDSVPCLYDTVSSTYLYNAGTGDFTYE